MSGIVVNEIGQGSIVEDDGEGRTLIYGGENALESARAALIAAAARDEALAYGSAQIYAAWADLNAVTGTAGDTAMVVSSDVGTHMDPVVSGTVANAGVFLYSASPAGWERIADLESTAVATSASAAAASAANAAASDTAAAASVTESAANAIAAAAAQTGAETAQAAAEAARDTAQEISVTGFTYLAPVATATTANITLSGEQTIDGVLTSASRVLVKNQSTPAQNGVYVSAAGAWARATDMDAAAEVAKKAVFVLGGATQGGKSVGTYSAVTTIGTDAIAFVEVADSSAVQDQIDALLKPQYTNAGGQGDRTGSIRVIADAGMVALGTIDNLVDGNETADPTNAVRFALIDMTGKRITFDFGPGASRVIREITWEINSATALWTVKWQGSRDGVSWTDLTADFVLGGSTTDIHDLSANSNGYRYYSLLGVSGSNPSASFYHEEVKFKIDADAADGVATVPTALFHDDFPTGKLISAWLFDEESGDTVKDHWGVSPIDLANAAVTDPNVTRTRQGAKTASGLIQTQSINNAREVVILYRTGYDQAGGFLISGGSGSGNSLSQDGYLAAETVKVAGCGFGLRTPVGRLNSSTYQAVKELNRGTWMTVFRDFGTNYNTILGFGGRHTATTSRCADFEIAYAFVFDEALSDAERQEVVAWLRKRAAADKGILFHREDCAVVAPLTVMLGDSQCDGRANLTDWPAFEQNTNFAPFMQIMAGGQSNVRNRFFTGLVPGVNQKIDSPITNGGIEESAGLELALAADYAVGLAGYDTVPHVVKYGIGGTHLAPSSTGTAVTGSTTWFNDELETGSIFHDAMTHLHRAMGVMVESGIGFDEVKFAIYLGDNDMGSTLDAPDEATYQGYGQGFWNEIKARFVGINAKALWFRPDPATPGNATAYANVRGGITALGAANDDITVIDTDAHTLTADEVHFSAAAYGLHAALVIAA